VERLENACCRRKGARRGCSRVGRPAAARLGERSSVRRGRGPGPLNRRRESSVATSRPAGRPWNACAPYDVVGTAGLLGGRTAARFSRRSRRPRHREACSGLGKARPASGTRAGGVGSRGVGGWRERLKPFRLPCSSSCFSQKLNKSAQGNE
jgi:hypothetical protein